MTARQLYGTDDDPYTILPSDIFEDKGTIDPETGLRSGFDFTLTSRATAEDLLLQIKTKVGKGEYKKSYRADITVINLSRIAGGALQVLPLQQAMVAEVNAGATPEQITHIEHATEKFNRTISFRLSRVALESIA